MSTRDIGVGRELFVAGNYDAEIVENVVAELARRGFEPSQVLDVGANIGTITIDLLSRFPEASAIAFEPDELNFGLLGTNLEANDLATRAEAHRAIVSDFDGSALLEIAPDNLGDHRVRVGVRQPGDWGEELWPTCPVPAWRLDTLVEDGRVLLDMPTLLWADVQGHEAQLLAGAQLLRSMPAVVEVWPYGLRRAGGYDRLQAQVASWPEILEVRGGIRRVAHEDLPAFVAEVEGRRDEPFTDLLLLPATMARC